MIVKAVGRHLRISPRKAREVIALIRGKGVTDAQDILVNTNKKAAAILSKLLHSATSNARYIPNLKEDDLYICAISADGGPCLKRFKAQAMGRASMIKRRTSHITIELDTREPIIPAKDIAKNRDRKIPKESIHKDQPVKASDKKTESGITKNKEVKKE